MRRLRRALLSILGAASLAPLLAGCGSQGTLTPGLAAGTIDVQQGIYRGVHLGMSLSELPLLVGTPLPTNDNGYVTLADAPPFLPADNPYDWVFPDMQLTFVEGTVASIEVYGLGAATRRGVAIGDPLDLVHREYSNARCIRGHAGEEPEAPGCQVQGDGHVFAYFSGDPIKVIAISDHPEIP